MPFLRFEIATPTEIDKIMVEQNKKMRSLQKQVEDLKMKLEVTALTRRQMEKIGEGLKKYQKWEDENTKLREQIKATMQFQKKMLDLPDEEIITIFRKARQYLQKEVNEKNEEKTLAEKSKQNC